MQNNEIRIVDICRVIWKWKTLLFIIILITGIITSIVSLLLPEYYKAISVILPTTSTSSSLGMSSLLGNLGMNVLGGDNENTYRYIAILKSRSLAEKVINKFNLQNRFKSKNLEMALMTFSKRLKYIVEDEGQIKITYSDTDQEVVANITNYIVECLDSINIMLSIDNAKNNRIFIESRVKEVTDSLNILQDELAKYMEMEGILSLEDQVRVGVENAALMKAQIIMKEIELEIAEKTRKGDIPQTIQLKYELSSLNDKFNSTYYNNDITQLVPNFNKLPEIEKIYLKLKMEIEYHYKILEFLGPQYEQAKIEETKNIPTISILDKAVRPEMRYKPRRTLMVIFVSAIVGLFGLLLVFFLDFIERERKISFSKLHR